MVLRSDELQLSRGEALRDTALVLSRHVAAIGVRTGPDEALEELAAHSSVPVVNMLTARHHPCQALADLLTLREACGVARGTARGLRRRRQQRRTLARGARDARGDDRGASPRRRATRSTATCSSPPGASGAVEHCTPTRARRWRARSAVYTDVWVSMGDERDGAPSAARRSRATASTTRCSTLAAPGAFAMHDLPAHPGEEITAEVLYGERQRIWDQAENRRHAQKALLELLLARS